MYSSKIAIVVTTYSNISILVTHYSRTAIVWACCNNIAIVGLQYNILQYLIIAIYCNTIYCNQRLIGRPVGTLWVARKMMDSRRPCTLCILGAFILSCESAFSHCSFDSFLSFTTDSCKGSLISLRLVRLVWNFSKLFVSPPWSIKRQAISFGWYWLTRFCTPHCSTGWYCLLNHILTFLWF